ncbi:MAG TPA: HAD-IA family hydrolase [Turneriella sp.]|nr:HAD-IA family hydrolase [Turneriella sp.]
MFDWDGTLYRSIDLIEASIVAAGQSVGRHISSAVARHIIGLGLKAAQSILFPGEQPDEKFLREFHLAYRRHYEAQEKDLSLYPGAYELVRDLADQGARIAVATAKSRSGINSAMAATGLDRYVSWSRTPEECRPKPDPQMIDEIVLEARAEKARTLMVGDTTHDLAMGLNAGVHIAGLCHGAHTEPELSNLNPLVLCNDIAALRRALLS